MRNRITDNENIKVVKLYISDLNFKVKGNEKEFELEDKKTISISVNQDNLRQLKITRSYLIEYKNYNLSATINALIVLDNDEIGNLVQKSDASKEENLKVISVIEDVEPIMQDKIAVYSGLLSTEAENNYMVIPHFKNNSSVAENND